MSLTLNTHAAQVGDPVVILMRDGDRSERAAWVTRVEPAGSGGRAVSAGPAVTVGYGPGRWNVTVDQHSAASVADVLPCEVCAARVGYEAGPCNAHKDDVWAGAR